MNSVFWVKELNSIDIVQIKCLFFWLNPAFLTIFEMTTKYGIQLQILYEIIWKIFVGGGGRGMKIFPIFLKIHSPHPLIKRKFPLNQQVFDDQDDVLCDQNWQKFWEPKTFSRSWLAEILSCAENFVCWIFVR